MLVYLERVKTQHSLLDINPLGLSLRTHTHLHCCQAKLQRIIKVDWVILVKLLKNEDCARGKRINQHQQLVNMGKEYTKGQCSAQMGLRTDVLFVPVCVKM